MHLVIGQGLVVVPRLASEFGGDGFETHDHGIEALARRRRGRYTPQAMSYYFNKFLREHEVPTRAHQFRHWFATNLYGTSNDLRLTQELMGHSNPATTAIYTAFNRNGAAAAIAELSFMETESAEAGWRSRAESAEDELVRLRRELADMRGASNGRPLGRDLKAISPDDGQELPGVA